VALRLGPLLVGLALLGLLAWSFGLEGVARAFADFSPARFAAYVALTAAVLAGYALRWQRVTRSLGGEVGLARLAAGRLAGDAVGSIVPSARLAGEPVRAAVACAGGVEVTQASAGVALDRVLETIGNVLCALLYVAVFAATRELPASDEMTGLAAGLIGGLAALAVPLVMMRLGARPLWPLYALLGARRPPWLAAVRRTEDHLIESFRRRPGVLLGGLLLALATEAVVVGQYHFLLSAFGVRVDLPTLLLILVGTGMARAVPTPAALGTLEGGQVAVLGLAAGDPALGFVAGLVIRMHETLLLLAGLAALSGYGMSLARLASFRSASEASA